MDRKDFVVEALRSVMDPHTGISVYEIHVDGGYTLHCGTSNSQRRGPWI